MVSLVNWRLVSLGGGKRDEIQVFLLDFGVRVYALP